VLASRLETFAYRDTGQKSRFCHAVPAFDSPLREGPVGISPYIIRKNIMVGLPEGDKKLLGLCLSATIHFTLNLR